MILRTNEKNKGRRDMDRKLESKANNIQKPHTIMRPFPLGKPTSFIISGLLLAAMSLDLASRCI